MRSWLAICTAKLAYVATRWRGGQGTSFPGKLALWIAPRLLAMLGGQLQECIVITGTNGKTTSTNLLTAMLRQSRPVLTNAQGANLEQGLVSALLRETNIWGRLRLRSAVLEIDEATLPRIASALPIRVLAVTNVFRDQLDRYGEIDTALQKLLTGIAQTDAVLVLNGDDPLARHIGLHSGRSTQYFGMDKDQATATSRAEMRDGAFCLECGQPLRYTGYFYGQLGLYSCPSEDFFRPHPEYIAHVVGDQLELRQGNLPTVQFTLPVRGLFNAYNALCAMAVARVCGLTADDIRAGLQAYQAPVGRMQTFATHPPATLNLIKNPAGCDSVLRALCQEPGEKVVCIAINDQAADGKDVSWLWDADFELMAEQGSARRCINSGSRAHDMALRLKYAGFAVDCMETELKIAVAIRRSLAIANETGARVHVLATYTALQSSALQLALAEEDSDGQQAHPHRPSLS